jgi:hypothetical protein
MSSQQMRSKLAQALEEPRQFQLGFGDQQRGDELEGRHEQHLHLVLLYEFPGDGAHVMRFAAPRQAKAQQIIPAAYEVPRQERRQESPRLLGELVLFERSQGKLAGNLRLIEQSLDLLADPGGNLVLRELMQEPPVSPVLPLSLRDRLGVLA